MTETLARAIPPFDLEARFQPSSYDADRRTVEVVWTTGATVRRGGGWFSDPFDETLSLDPGHIRLQRLNSGRAPFLDSHRSWNTRDVLGVIEAGSVEVTATEGRARVRLDDGEEAQEIARKIGNGILGNVSVGYRVHRFEDRSEDENQKVRDLLAVDWEPYEVSLVPIGADAESHTRAAEKSGMNDVEIVRAGATKEAEMDEETVEQGSPEQTRTTPEPQDAPETTVTVADPPEESRSVDEQVRAAIQRDRARTTEIRSMCRSLGIDAEAADELIDSDQTLDECRKAIIEKRAEMDKGTVIHHQLEVGREAPVKRNEAIADAILHRGKPGLWEITDEAKDLRYMPLMQLGRLVVESQGARGLERMAPIQLAETILGQTRASGMQSSSDFPLILENVQNKSIRREYDEAEATWAPLVDESTAKDFKEMVSVQYGEAPRLDPVNESGEYEEGTIGEGAERFKVIKYGKIVTLTLEAMMNDDLGVLVRTPGKMGRQGRHKESDLVYSAITTDVAMADGDPVFHANHNNIGSGAIGVTGLDAGRVAMRNQKGLDGVTHLDIRPRYLLVPTAKETLAAQEVRLQTVPNQSSQTSPFRGNLELISDPRLDDNSTLEWYLVAPPSDIESLRVAYMEGQRTPTIRMQEGFRTDGIQYRVRHFFGVKFLDYRGWYRSSGS